MRRSLALLIGAWLLMAGASCDKGRPDPNPAPSSLCGTGPDGPIWCPVPPSDRMPTMQGGN